MINILCFVILVILHRYQYSAITNDELIKYYINIQMILQATKSMTIVIYIVALQPWFFQGNQINKLYSETNEFTNSRITYTYINV